MLSFRPYMNVRQIDKNLKNMEQNKRGARFPILALWAISTPYLQSIWPDCAQ